MELNRIVKSTTGIFMLIFMLSSCQEDIMNEVEKDSKENTENFESFATWRLIDNQAEAIIYSGYESTAGGGFREPRNFVVNGLPITPTSIDRIAGQKNYRVRLSLERGSYSITYQAYTNSRKYESFTDHITL